MIAAVAFYLFATVLVVSSMLVVTTSNPVHSVLFLILAFFNASALFLLVGAEFLAMILVIVYVGAVAVLFLFVVMMLDIDFVQLREGFQRYLPIGGAIGIVLLAELGMVLSGWRFGEGATTLRALPRDTAIDNTTQLGLALYTDYILLFQTSGLVLFVAMIGAIVLTHRDQTGNRRQEIANQIGRVPSQTLKLVDVPRGIGLPTLPTVRSQIVEDELGVESISKQDPRPGKVHGGH